MIAAERRIRIMPSLLSADFAHLADDIASVARAGAELLHLDIMDGHFVPNISIGIPVVKSVRQATTLFLDAHLMIQYPERYAQAFCDAGADLVTVHCECEGDPHEALEIVRKAGRKTGIAINPETPFARMEPFVREVDLVLVMSVHPGFGGQKFMPEVLPKLEQARQIGRPGTWFQIDGGLNRSTIADAVRAGADIIVAGSAVFGDDPIAAMRDLKRLGDEALENNWR